MMDNIVNRYNQNSEGIILPYKLIEEAYSKGNLKALTLFVLLKQRHRNGVIYNTSSRSIAENSNHSHSTVNAHISTLITMGLVERQIGKNGKKQLRLRGYKHYINRWGNSLVFIKFGTKFEINETLNAQIAIKHIRKQEYRISKKQGCNRILEKIVESPENYSSLSDRNLANVMNKSNATANRMKKKWNELGLITISPIWSVLLTDVTESQYRNAKLMAAIPSYAVFERHSKRILIRKADAVEIGRNLGYKYTPNSWVPNMIKLKSITNNINTGQIL
jgi:predicted transcriptional regulator